jgi:hypothetical protein
MSDSQLELGTTHLKSRMIRKTVDNVETAEPVCCETSNQESGGSPPPSINISAPRKSMISVGATTNTAGAVVATASMDAIGHIIDFHALPI